MSIELVMPSNHLIFCCPLLLPSVFPSIKVFASESAIHIRWPKYWSFSFSINEYSGLIFFRIDWFDVLGLQGTLESLLHRLTMNLSSVNSVRHSVMFYSLQPHGLQHTRPPCPSPNPRVYSNSCPLSRWCHPTISSSVVPFSSCLQSFPASGSFPMSQFFTSGGQNTGVSASASVLPMNTQDWSPLGWTHWIYLQSKGLSRVFPNITIQKHQFFSPQLSL